MIGIIVLIIKGPMPGDTLNKLVSTAASLEVPLPTRGIVMLDMMQVFSYIRIDQLTG